jgi:hypothetical protein
LQELSFTEVLDKFQSYLGLSQLPWTLIGLIAGFLLLVFLLLWTVSYILPGTWKLTAKGELPYSREQVFSLVRDLRYWPIWFVKGGKAPNWFDFAVRNRIYGVDARLVWEGDRIPSGQLVILEEDPPEKVTFFLLIESKHLEGSITLEPYDENQTRLKWSIQGNEEGKVFRKYLIPLFRRQAKKLINHGYAGLKSVLEQEPKQSLQQSKAPASS